MRHILCILSLLLLLGACNDIDGLGNRLPESASIDAIRSLSDVAYDELESMVPDDYLKEDMRKYGGLLVQASFNITSDLQTYDDAPLFYADNYSNLPPDGYSEEISQLNVDNKKEPAYYLEMNRLSEGNSRLSHTFYCRVYAYLWNEKYPGFVDDCLKNNYGNSALYSDVKSYTWSPVAVITNCDMRTMYYGIMGATFDVYGLENRANSGVSIGLCYSKTKTLPDIDDEVAFYEGDDFRHVSVEAKTGEAGDYYVRAFAVVDDKIVYSPVWKVNVL